MGNADPRQSLPRCTAVSAITLRNELQPQGTRQRRQHSRRRAVLGDLAMQQDWPMPVDKVSGGKRVLIVGAGPSGLSAAYHLTRLGHQVEIHDAGPLPAACCISAFRPIACHATSS